MAQSLIKIYLAGIENPVGIIGDSLIMSTT